MFTQVFHIIRLIKSSSGHMTNTQGGDIPHQHQESLQHHGVPALDHPTFLCTKMIYSADQNFYVLK